VSLEVTEVRPTPAELAGYAEVPIAYTVASVLEVELVDGGLGGVRFTERPLDEPWVKDYDALDGAAPTDWPPRFDLDRWGIFVAHDRGRRVGGLAVAFDTRSIDPERGRADHSALWDLRVAPEHRGRGVGRALVAAALAGAARQSASTCTVETQNVNVPACRFYRALGATVASIDRFAYPGLPDEVQIIWSLAL
jgi:GNAT superfamily N-acetyltransferase